MTDRMSVVGSGRDYFSLAISSRAFRCLSNAIMMRRTPSPPGDRPARCGRDPIGICTMKSGACSHSGSLRPSAVSTNFRTTRFARTAAAWLITPCPGPWSPIGAFCEPDADGWDFRARAELK